MVYMITSTLSSDHYNVVNQISRQGKNCKVACDLSRDRYFVKMKISIYVSLKYLHRYIMIMIFNSLIQFLMQLQTYRVFSTYYRGSSNSADSNSPVSLQSDTFWSQNIRFKSEISKNFGTNFHTIRGSPVHRLISDNVCVRFA